MILDSLNNTEKVECLHPLFKKAFDYVKATDFSKMEDGKYELDGSRLFVSVSEPNNEEKDIAFFVDRPTAYTKIYPGQFAIYFPEDGHAPGIGEGNIRKVIVKVQVEE